MKKKLIILGSIKLLLILGTLTGCQPMNARLVKHEPKTDIIKSQEPSSLAHKDFISSVTERIYLIRGYQLKERGGQNQKALIIITSRTELGRSSPLTVSFQTSIVAVNPKDKDDAWKGVRVGEYNFDPKTNQPLWNKEAISNMHVELLMGLEEHLKAIGFTADVNFFSSDTE